ncbi:DUF6276 family protein, partial [Halobium palmae]
MGRDSGLTGFTLTASSKPRRGVSTDLSLRPYDARYMGCSHCGGDLVAFAVPEDLRGHAPGGGEFAALCSGCLRVEAA